MIDPTLPDILQLLRDGHAADEAAHDAEESSKLGKVRGGSLGVLGDDGASYGKCPRLAWLRAQGYKASDPTDPEWLQDLFQAGHSNETIVQRILAPVWDGKITDDSENGFEFEREGVTYSGRPDLVLHGAEGPELVIENKLVSSIWTAKGVHYELQPKSDHLVQAAFYSVVVGAPACLLYSSRCYWHLSTAPKWLQAKFAPGCYDVDFKDDGQPLRIQPFNRAYYLTWAQGRLTYWTEGMDAPRPTLITEDAVYEWGAMVAGADAGTALPRPSARHVDGGNSYSPCNYCMFKSVCDTVDDPQERTDRMIAEAGVRYLGNGEG